MKIHYDADKTMELESGMSLIEIAKSLGMGAERTAYAAAVDGVVRDLRDTLEKDSDVMFMDFSAKAGQAAYRHTASHILAQAVKRIWPDAKLAIGPAIDSGFYYDFDVDFTFSSHDLENIEKEMRAIIKENLPIERSYVSRDEALRFFAAGGESYKVALIEDLPENEVITTYTQGGFTDLCAGPHIGSTGKVKAVKLLSVAGAYWRGDERNKMLQRIYGTAFPSKAELDGYLEKLEEAKKRDHRKLGRELDLFDIYEEGPGFPFLFPKGMIIRNELEAFWRKEHRKAGYGEVRTPIILNEELWRRSGHWDHYYENMYFTSIDDMGYVIKPMNCPGGMLAFKRKPVSYRDLPIRIGEIGLVHRHEKSGTLHGLMRVRCFNQDDAHIFMTDEQIEPELVAVAQMIDRFYSLFGCKYSIELSTKPENAMGSDEEWERAINALRAALRKIGKPYTVNEGDGAFYGPKIDFHLEDSIGRTWQCGTIQLDMQMPERFDLTYTGADGQKHRPVMIHRVIYGAIERFIAILTEHFGGAFPVWLAPVQVKVLPLAEKYLDYARQVHERLFNLDIRSELDTRDEKIGFKIREAQLEKVPYMLIVGEKEETAGTVSVRCRKRGDLGSREPDDFYASLRNEIDSMAL